MATLETVGVLSSAKLLASLMALAGLAAGILYSFGGAIFDVLVTKGWVTSASSGTWSTPGVSWGTALAFLALLGMPIIFATSGFIAGAVGAFLYNLVARWVGGIELHLEQ